MLDTESSRAGSFKNGKNAVNLKLLTRNYSLKKSKSVCSVQTCSGVHVAPVKLHHCSSAVSGYVHTVQTILGPGHMTL